MRWHFPSVLSCRSTSSRTCTQHTNNTITTHIDYISILCASVVRIEEFHRCSTFANILLTLHPKYTFMVTPCMQSCTERSCRLMYAFSPVSCFASCTTYHTFIKHCNVTILLPNENTYFVDQRTDKITFLQHVVPVWPHICINRERSVPVCTVRRIRDTEELSIKLILKQTLVMTIHEMSSMLLILGTFLLSDSSFLWWTNAPVSSDM